MSLRVGADPGTRVRDARLDAPLRGPGLDPDPALLPPLAHRLLGVVEEVDQHLLDLVEIEHGHRQGRREGGLDLDVVDAEVIRLELERFLDDAVET